MRDTKLLDVSDCRRLLQIVCASKSSNLYEWASSYFSNVAFAHRIKGILEKEKDVDIMGLALICLRDSEIPVEEKADLLTTLVQTKYEDAAIYTNIAQVAGHLLYHSFHPRLLDLLFTLRNHQYTLVEDEVYYQLSDIPGADGLGEESLTKLFSYLVINKVPGADFPTAISYIVKYLAQNFNITYKKGK